MPRLNLDAEPAALTRALVDIGSVSHEEAELADAVQLALRRYSHLDVLRHGNTIVARTLLQRARRVVVAGHLDTVPVNDNLPSRVDDEFVHGLGSCDMKGGVAIALSLAARLSDPPVDVTYMLYEGEEVEQEFNGLALLAHARPELLGADFAILMEPSNAIIEAGCQGSLLAEVTVPGRRAHSARSWMGTNAIHDAAPVLTRLAQYQPRRPHIDGLPFHEGLNAVSIRGGVAMNVIPDECVVQINYRFAPDRSTAEAEAFLHDFFDGFGVTVIERSPAAHPSLAARPATSLVAATGGNVKPKLGWTDVARFISLGVPAVNYGPGDPLLAHAPDERVAITQINRCHQLLGNWLTTTTADW